MAKKMKRFDEGGYTGDDEIVKYRMGMIDAKGNDLTKSKKETIADNDPYGAANKETSADLDPYGAASKSTSATPKARKSTVKDVEKTTAKTAAKTAAKTDTKASMNDMPESLRAPDYKAPSMAKAVSKEVTKPTTKSTSKFDPAAAVGVRKPDPAPGYMMKPMGLKSGGGVKSASARADGCAIRGKTRA